MADPGTSSHVTPVIRLKSCSHAAISASRLASSAMASLTVSKRVRGQPVFREPGWLARQMLEQRSECGGVGGAGQPDCLSERDVDLGHAV